MKSLIITALLLLVGLPVGAQEKPTLHIPMTGGLNTNTNPFLLQDGEFTQLMNWDLSSEFGTLTLRKGFKAVTDSVSNIVTGDSTVVAGHVWNTVIKDYGGTRKLQVAVYVDTSQNSIQSDGFFDGEQVIYYGAPTDSALIDNYFVATNFLDVAVLIIADTTSTIAASDSVFIDRANANIVADSGEITGVYSYYDRNGQKYLATVMPSTNSNGQWSRLMLSREGEYNPTFELSNNIFKGETPIWTTWNGQMIVVLPRQRPVAFDGKFTHPLQPRAPGQIEAIPIPRANDTGKLDGYYRYALLQRFAGGTSADSFATHLSYVTPLIQANNEDMKITGFIANAPDSGHSSPDNLTFFLMRTHGYPQGLAPVQDTFFSLDSITATYATLDTLTIIDTRPDATLTDTVSNITIYPIDSTRFADSTGITDSLSNTFGLTQQKFTGLGGIRHIKTWRGDTLVWFHNTSTGVDTAIFVPTDTVITGYTHDSNVVKLTGSPFIPTTIVDPKDSNWAGTGYFYTYLDTVSGAESDSSVNLTIPVIRPSDSAADEDITAYELGIPKVLPSDSGLVRKIYKYQWYWSKFFDTTVNLLNDTNIVGIYDFIEVTSKGIIAGSFDFDDPGQYVGINSSTEQYFVRGDTVFVNRLKPNKINKFELHTTIPAAIKVLTTSTDSTFLDTLTWVQTLTGLSSGADTLNLRRQTVNVNFWNPQVNLTNVTYAYPYGGRLWMSIGSQLYRSEVNVAGIVQPFQDVAFNLDDGDAITAIIGLGPNLRVFKNFSSIVLYDPLNDLPQKGSQTFGIGCVAPNSLEEWGGKLFYLSADGVIAEQTAQFKDYGIKQGLISQNINNLLIGDRSLADLKTAVAAPIFDDKYIITFPGSDTSFVYHLQLDKWSMWDFSFSQATLYDTLTTEGLVRSKDVVFAKSGDERLFRYAAQDAMHFDSGSGSFVEGSFTTRPVFADPNQWQITQMGFHRSDSIIGNVSVIGDSADASVASATYGSEARDYLLKGIAPNSSRWFEIKYTTNLLTTNELNKIYGIDVWAIPAGRQITK